MDTVWYRFSICFVNTKSLVLEFIPQVILIKQLKGFLDTIALLLMKRGFQSLILRVALYIGKTVYHTIEG